MGQRDAGGGVKNFPMIGGQAAFGQDQARVAMGETGQSIADQQGLTFGQIEGGEPIAEEIEHAGDGDGGVIIAQGRERRLKSDASGIPQGRVGITGVFGEEGDAVVATRRWRPGFGWRSWPWRPKTTRSEASSWA